MAEAADAGRTGHRRKLHDLPLLPVARISGSDGNGAKWRAMEVDDAKRAQTLAAHSLDMARALAVFTGASLTVESDRGDYAEARFSTIGFLGRRARTGG